MIFLLLTLHFQAVVSLEDEENDVEEYVLDSPLEGNQSGTRSRFLAATSKKVLKKGANCDARTYNHNVCDGVSANKGTGLLYCCKKHCRNVLGDRNNCGTCGRKCQQWERCCGGVCTNVMTSTNNCGKCNRKCSSGITCDYGFCGVAFAWFINETLDLQLMVEIPISDLIYIGIQHYLGVQGLLLPLEDLWVDVRSRFEECVGHGRIRAEGFLFVEGPRLKVRECLESHLVLAKSWPKRDLSAGRKETMHECGKKERVELCVAAVTDSDWKSLVLGSDLPVLVEFWAPWCGPCRMIHPTIEKIAKVYAGKLKCFKVNTDVSPAIATQYGIRSIPTVIIYKNGEKQDAIIGAVPESALVTSIEKFM
ncbi:thioredoxin [Dorcoceras hygrometricum]|uniref:Thioredoxin n=1 Tax=Dorcoceras hygrometricum TaxID=472368 RepID=A0A2Z7B6R7_9LAMI|nr:thioredoxin [Dorcoceras hygrometricum]